jgi:hypothetical protein
MASLMDMSRGELEAYAADLGVEDPEGYPNMGALRDAIRAKEAAPTQEETVADDETTPEEQDTAPDAAPGAGDGGQAEVQALMDKEQEQGFVGRKVDPLDDTVWSLEGGAPEPGDNYTTPSEEDVKKNPRLGDQYEGQATYTEAE